MQPAIEVIAVSKSFGPVKAVRDISLTVGEGEFFSLLGPSGCGKTTLLRMIAGFETPTQGRLLVAGKEMLGVPPHKRPVNMVFQSYALFPHLTVYENVAFGLKATGSLPVAEIAERVAQALELVRLPQLARRYPAELSGGQQQRIAFARAIVNKPFVLLLDEPLSALDPRIREEMQTELARFKRELGITFVMVTHDQSEAFALSDRIAVFNGGQIEQVGTPQQIYERPQSEFVADFIGHSNLLKARVAAISTDGNVELQCGPLVLTAVLDRSGRAQQQPDRQELDGRADLAALSVHDQVVLCIRSDDFEPAATSIAAANLIEATVLHRSYRGSSSLLFLQVGDLKLTAQLSNAATAAEGGDMQVGSRVRLSVPAAAIKILPQPAASPVAIADKVEA